jgi:hypothetical protein
MTNEERTLLELLKHINEFERRCRRLNAPPVVYKRLGQLRDEVARWGTEEIVIQDEDPA